MSDDVAAQVETPKGTEICESCKASTVRPVKPFSCTKWRSLSLRNDDDDSLVGAFPSSAGYNGIMTRENAVCLDTTVKVATGSTHTQIQ